MPLGTKVNHLRSLLNAIDPEKFDTLQDIWEYLRVSELMLKDILEGQEENPEFTELGHAEFGYILHYLHNPPDEILGVTSADPIVQAAWNLLTHPSKPDSTITTDYIENFSSAFPIVAKDGTLWGFKQYEQFDFRWAGALINMAITWGVGRHAFGSLAPCKEELQPFNGSNTVRLGILGDWGTGEFKNGNAIAVMDQLKAMNCDYLFHLGDVYYAGTGPEPYSPPNEENDNFINYWPTTHVGRSFTLNSNHEMYSGGNGYFPQALANPIFGPQNMKSYFMLTFGKWVILGLDSAYNASQTSLYMKGDIGTEQTAWIQDIASKGGFTDKKIMVMTHHNAFEYQGATPPGKLLPLWEQVTTAIGRAPNIWYWGHIHNAIVYKPYTENGQLSQARCLGHSAIPFGKASGLLRSDGRNIDSIEYFAHTPDPNGGKRVLNGYATLELNKDGGITEKIFESGNSRPVWMKTTVG